MNSPAGRLQAEQRFLHQRLRVGQHGEERRQVGLPVKAPWRNAIEPTWVHGTRAVVGPDRKLTADELRQRVCDYFGCAVEPPLAKPAA